MKSSEVEIPTNIFDNVTGHKVLMYAASFKGDGYNDSGRCAIALLDSCSKDVELAVKFVRKAHKHRLKNNV